MNNITKRILILRAAKDVCGDEMSLIESHCQLLGFDVHKRDIGGLDDLQSVLGELQLQALSFDYLYLCTHGNPDCFLANMAGTDQEIAWAYFSQCLCENGTMTNNGIILLACCKGGFYQVAADIFACCNTVNFVCGVKWNVSPWDLTTGFVVFIHNMETKRAEPAYAAQKASLATDYSFVCYDRDEAEMNPSYIHRRFQVFRQLGWIDDEGNWIEDDEVVTANADNENFPKKQ